MFFFTNLSFANDKNISTDDSRLLGLASSVFLGFGSGPVIQGQENNRPIIYASTQGLGFLLLLFTFGDCHPNNSSCKDKNDLFRSIGATLFIAGRLAEIADSTYFFINNYGKEKSPVIGISYVF